MPFVRRRFLFPAFILLQTWQKLSDTETNYRWSIEKARGDSQYSYQRERESKLN